MFEITTEAEFSASHILPGYTGPCGRLHGHNYQVRITAEGEELDELGMLLDTRVLKRTLAEVLSGLDHTHLNDLPYFRRKPPSAENIAKYVFDQVMSQLEEESGDREVWLREVRVAESKSAWALYRP